MNKSFRGAGALSTIARVDSLRCQTHCDALEWPCFALRVQCDSHGDATAKRCQHERIGIRSGAVTAGIHRFVGDQCLVFAIAHFVLQVSKGSYRYVAHFVVSLFAERISDSASCSAGLTRAVTSRANQQLALQGRAACRGPDLAATLVPLHSKQ